MSSVTDQPADVPPTVRVFEMLTSVLVTQMIEVATEHRLAFLLADGPRTSADLANATGTHEQSLYRLLRAMTGLGLVTEHPGRSFALTPVGEAMRLWDDAAWGVEAMYHLSSAVRTGRSGFEAAHGEPLFEYFDSHPERGAHFDRIMAGVSSGEPAAVAEAYDFSEVRRLVDIGGGNGTHLGTILARHPHLQGVVFDQPRVIDALGPAAFEAVGGDFFAAVPENADAYFMSHILHDWNDEDCLTILRNIRSAIAADGRLLIAETVIPPGDGPAPGKMFDMLMLAFTGEGQERTEAEWADLLGRAGFELTAVVPTASPVSVVEAYPR